MPGKEEKRAKYVAQIQNNVRNLVVILNDFLSLSKLEEGKVQSKPEHFNLIEFVNNLIDEMQPNRKRGQKIKLIAGPGSVPVYLDSKLLQHVFTNLLSNAIKYSEEGSEITVTLEEENENVSVSVTDQGIGIPKEEQDNLFGRFFRAANSTNIQGTGLGLHIVKQYTELMGGTVSFNSEVGKGSTFIVKFKSTINT
jgi:signal transduction histidine kinase